MNMMNNENYYAGDCRNIYDGIFYPVRDGMQECIPEVYSIKADPDKNHAAVSSDNHIDSGRETWLDLEEKEKGRLSRLEIMVSEVNYVDTGCEGEWHSNYKLLYEIMSKATAEALIKYIEENDSEIESIVFYGGESLPAQQVILYICDCLSDILINVPDYQLVCDSIHHINLHIEEIKKHHITISDLMGMGTFNQEFYALRPRFCQAGFERFAIGSNGDIYPCYGLRNAAQWKMGTIFDEKWEESENCQKVKSQLLRLYCKSRCRKGIWGCALCVERFVPKQIEHEKIYCS